ncbi:transcriptional activator hac1 [Xylaria flabelliformis]|nr:transcriptional activator hac1 [Xylaria flabelliformis]
METSQTSTSAPQVKFEASPAESFLSTPGELYPSLFASTPTATAMDPEGVMTPESYADDDNTASNPDPSTPAAEGEKKPVKKRKSWGQVLPEPKTNLPPRKRAKTEDEKEQRRVERVLRNRRAAQSSRERKRLEVEALEQRNAALEAALREQQKQTMALMEELSKLRRNAGVVSRSPSPLNVFQPSPMTLSQPLFQESADGTAQPHSGIMDDLIMMPEQDGTVDPASISPELNPIADSDLKTTSTTTVAETEPVAAPSTAAASSDVTQHPAAVLCDLQCPSVEAVPSWAAQTQTSPYQLLLTWLMASSVLISACYRPLTLITGALKSNLVLRPTPSILSTIIWIVTLPPNFRNSTSISSSATTSAAQHPARPRHTTRSPKCPNPLSASSTLRIKSLQRLLTSSPNLARPLMDATMEVLRLVSEGREDRVEGLATGSPGIKGDQSRGPLLWPDGASLPSREVLLTLLWALRVEERKILSRENKQVSPASSRPGSSVLRKKTSTDQTNVLSVMGKRKGEGEADGTGKRIRLGL